MSRNTLSERERESLDGILAHKTAKEIARDLGISHHAVEKRLKRAREKLGATTSLEAARLYAARYGSTVSGASDLSLHASTSEGGRLAEASGFRVLQTGGSLAMFSSIILFSTLGLAAAPEPADTFALLDRDGSGFIELREFTATVSGRNVSKVEMKPGQVPQSDAVPAEEAQQMIGDLFDRIDRNKDGKIDREEFLSRGDTGDVRVVVIEKP